jgi:hypothetical protein
MNDVYGCKLLELISSRVDRWQDENLTEALYCWKLIATIEE